MSIDQVHEDLLCIEHPKYEEAKISLNITWKLICKHCGTVHYIDTETTELDPCCDNPNFGELNESH